jgi:hypothetical protein
MILVKEASPYETAGYIHIHNDIVTNKILSDKAKVLYGYLLSLTDKDPCDDTSVCNALDTTVTTLSRTKKELKNAGLMVTECIAPGTWVTYLGNPNCPASKVKEIYRADVISKVTV